MPVTYILITVDFSEADCGCINLTVLVEVTDGPSDTVGQIYMHSYVCIYTYMYVCIYLCREVCAWIGVQVVSTYVKKTGGEKKKF